MDLRIAHKELKRVNKSIAKSIEKRLERFQGAEWVLALNYIAQTDGIVQSRWMVKGSSAALVSKLEEWQPALDNALAVTGTDGESGSMLRKPTSATKRATVVRKMLRFEWLRYVHGTPSEGKKQCFDIVKRGDVPLFPWWDSVVGADVPFESISIDMPEVSGKLFDYLCVQS